ncbi:MAG: hypothetical protein WAX69_05490, partial [Victivallales bacterium]
MKSKIQKTLSAALLLLAYSFISFGGADFDKSPGTLGCHHQYWVDYYNKLSEAIRPYYLETGESLPRSLGYYDDSSYQIYNGGDGKWDTSPAEKGKNNGVYYFYTGRGLSFMGNFWTTASPIWQDTPGGRPGIFDEGADVVLYAGNAQYVLKNGDAGVAAEQIFYNDKNSNSTCDGDEELWLDTTDYMQNLKQLMDSLRGAVYFLMRERYVNFQAGDDFTGMEKIPHLLECDSNGNPLPSSIKLFPERPGDDAYLFTLVPAQLDDGTIINNGHAVYGMSNTDVPVFPIHFEELRSVLNMNLFKWLEIRGRWTSKEELNSKSVSVPSNNETAQIAYGRAVNDYAANAGTSVDVSPGASCLISSTWNSSSGRTEYGCQLVRGYAYLEVKFKDSINISYSADYYVKGGLVGSGSDVVFDPNGDNVVNGKYTRFAQQPQTTENSITSLKFGSTGNPPSYGRHSGYSTESAVVLKFNFPVMDIAAPAGFATIPDTDRDGIIDVGVIPDSDQQAETGIIYHTPESNEPQVFIPITNFTRDGFGNAVGWDYIAQAGTGMRRKGFASTMTFPFSTNRLLDYRSPQAKSSSSCLFYDIFWNDASLNVHIKRVGLVRPGGQVVVFDFPWDSQNMKFADIGVPIGINKNRQYRLVMNPDSSISNFPYMVYGLCFESGITHLFYVPHYSDENHCEVNFIGGWYAVGQNKRMLGYPPSSTRISYGSYFQNYAGLYDFKYDVSFEWADSGLLNKVVYTAKNDPSTKVEVALQRDEDGKITALKKKVPQSLSVNGQTEYEISINGDTITYPAGITSKLEAETAAGSRTATITRTVPGSGISIEKYIYDVNENLIEHSIDANNDTKTTVFEYYDGSTVYPNTTRSNEKLKSVVYPDGSWKYFEYDARGWLSKTYSPFKSAPAAPSADGKSVEYFYDQNETGDTVSERTLSQLPRTVMEKIGGAVTSKTLFSYLSDTYDTYLITEKKQICADPASGWDADSNLKYEIRYSSYDLLTPRLPSYSFSPDERNDFTYAQSGIIVNPYSDRYTSIKTHLEQTARTTTSDGVQTFETTSVVNPRGGIDSVSTKDYSTQEVVSSLSRSRDSFGRITRTDYLDGTFEKFEDYCLYGPQSYTDRTGNQYFYAYYPTGQIQSVDAPTGITAYIYDALGNTTTVISTPIGADAILKEYSYDALSRTTKESDDFDDTIHQYTGLEENTTYPDGTSKKTVRYLDGSMASVSGTAVHPIAYDYGISADGYREQAGVPGGPSTITYYNMLGQACKTVSGSGYTVTTTFDAKGRPELVSDGQHSKRISYNARNEVSQIVEDGVTTGYTYSTGSGKYSTIATTSKDPETFTTKSEVLFTGLESWETVNGRVTHTKTELLGNGSTKTTTTDPAVKSIVSTSAPFASSSALAVGTDAATTITSVANTLDGVGRVKGSTTWQGTSAIEYRGGTPQPTSIKTPDSRTTTLAYSSGKYTPTSVTTPYGTNLTPNFETTGEFKGFDANSQAHGIFNATASYNDLGKVSSLVTSGQPGSATTAWSFDSNGMLQSKSIAGSTAYSMSYFNDGRINTLTKSLNGSNVTREFKYTNDARKLPAGSSYSDGGLTPEVKITGHKLFGEPGSIETTGVSTHVYEYNPDRQVKTIAFSPTATESTAANFTYSYDNLHSLRSSMDISCTGIEDTVSYEYDEAGRLSKLKRGDMDFTYAYISGTMNMVKTITSSKGGLPVLVRNVNYAPNSSRVASVTNSGSQVFNSFAYEYLPNTDKISSVKLKDGSQWSYSYDPRGQLTGAVKLDASNASIFGTEFAYASDSITNVLQGGRRMFGGEPEMVFTPSIINSVSVRNVGTKLQILGTALVDAEVTVNGQDVTRDGIKFFLNLEANNQNSAVMMAVDVVGVQYDPAATPTSGGNKAGNVAGADIIAEFKGEVFIPQSNEALSYDNGGRLSSDSGQRYYWNAKDQLIKVESRIANSSGKLMGEKHFYDYSGRR